MGRLNLLLVALLFLIVPCTARGEGEEGYWADTVKQTHAKFTGQKGTFAQFGDSITVTLAYWTPLLYSRKNASPEMEKAFQAVNAYLKPECWRDWKGLEYGSDGGRTSAWALENVDGWLKKLNPEAALIMFGTNDLHEMELPDYKKNMKALVQKCLENGTVVILSTIPPRHGYEEKAASFAEAARDLARELKVPLVDYYAEILKRRPADWDGSMEKFRPYQGYEVPTLISADGVHPSCPTRYANDYSEEGLRNCGYGLRSYLSLMMYDRLIKTIGQ